MTLETAPAPDEVYAAYREVLAEQAQRPPNEWTFKAHPAYRRILEHVTAQQGREYLALLEQSPRWDTRARLIVADAALANDSVGCPERADFDSLGITCSPTNLRYATQALAVWEQIERVGLYAVSIVEIGGGYGGLALFFYRFARLFDCEVRFYTIYDLPEAGAIQRAYCARMGLSVATTDGTRQSSMDATRWTARNTCFLVSCYGFSEFSPEVQAYYKEQVVDFCDHGYLVWNGPMYQFTDKPLTIEPERPQTGGGNTIVRF